MPKNEKTLSVSDIEEKKLELESDLEKIQGKIKNLDKMRVQLTTQGNAINGAIQQCVLFLTQLEASTASSIPSQDDSAVQTALS